MKIYMKDGKALSYNQQFFTPKSTGETWVLNENISPFIGSTSEVTYSANFISNNNSFNSIRYTEAINAILYYDDILVFGGRIESSWTDQAYRTITFLEPPTGDLLTWLNENGVKQ